ncbi:MAG: hypothetical protein ABL925_14010, partial [Methylococcales bacterium]
MVSILWRVFVCVLMIANCSLLLPGCKEQTTIANPPEIYLLNHKHWTNSLVLNFTDALAPADDSGNALPASAAPQLDPAIPGAWYWQDPSRLVFLPERQTIAPDSSINISLDKLKLHPSYRLGKKQLHYQTPPLKLIQHSCTWQDSDDAPLRRQLNFSLEFNYPLEKPSLSAALENGSNININSASGHLINAQTDQLLRPAQDTDLTATLNSGKVLLLQPAVSQRRSDLDYPALYTFLRQSETCQLQLIRADWDKFDQQSKAIPTVKDIAASQENSKINVSLSGDALTESAKKANPGKPVTAGVSIEPNVDGAWVFGESAGGADLIFTPKAPELLQPGTTYNITVSKDAFANLVFEKPEYSAKLEMPRMQASISDMQLYSDPQTPEVKRVTATLHFTYPPSRDGLSANTAVDLSVYGGSATALGFAISYDDKQPLLAYLKTDPIAINNNRSELRIAISNGITAATGGVAGTGDKQSLAIPSAQDYFTVSDLNVQTVIKEDGDLLRLIMLQTNVALKNPMDLETALQV